MAAPPIHRPRVLLYGSFKPPGEPCGITSSVRGLVSSSLSRAYELEMVSTNRPQARWGLPHRLGRGVTLGLSAIRRMRRGGTELVDVHTASGRDFLKHGAVMIAARLAGKPLLIRIHGGAFIDVFRNASPSRRRLIRSLLRLGDRLVTLSEGWRDALLQLAPSLQVEVLANSIDRPHFETIAESRSNQARGVLLLGNLCRDKGHFDLLRAAAGLDHHDFEILFAGAEREPGARAALERLADELGMRARVEFLGPVFGAALDEVMARASVFALPSYIENMPVSIMEAMATGLPVVGTTVGAIPEMIEDGVTGQLVPPGDVGRLQSALAGLLANPAERKRLGAAARAASARWDRETVGAATRAVYAAVIGGHHG